MPSYINSEQIFPKRLGIMNGNTLVLEYYDLAKDKFKKHLIPFETETQTRTKVEQIFKNPKHIPFLKKVNPKHITAVLQGHKIGVKTPSPQDNFQQFRQLKHVSVSMEQRNFTKEKQNFYQQQTKQDQPVFNDNNKPAQKYPYEIQKINPKAHEPQQYYNQQFEDFQISASIDKGSNLTSNFSKIQSSNQDKSSVSKNESSKTQPVKQYRKQKKQKETVQEIVQQYEDDFQFINQEAQKKQQKKQKKEKKEKKEKDKNKSKSKDKKSKKQKESKKQLKDGGAKNKAEEKQVQQEFQFL